ncbi:MAG: hypothetical protein ABII90_09855 [Bacteroidota bacterium]
MYDLDCSENKYDLSSVVYYGNDDKIITTKDYITTSEEYEYRSWYFIPPGTMMELVREAVCKKVRRG